MKEYVDSKDMSTTWFELKNPFTGSLEHIFYAIKSTQRLFNTKAQTYKVSNCKSKLNQDTQVQFWLIIAFNSQTHFIN